MDIPRLPSSSSSPTYDESGSSAGQAAGNAGQPNPSVEAAWLQPLPAHTAPTIAHRQAQRPRLPNAGSLLAHLTSLDVAQRVLPLPACGTAGPDRQDVRQFEPQEFSSACFSQDLAEFHAQARRCPERKYDGLVRRALETGSVHIQVGEEFDQEGATVWDDERREHILQIRPRQTAPDGSPLPLGRSMVGSRVTMLIEMSNAANQRRFSELDACVEQGKFENDARVVALTPVEQRLLRHPGDAAAVLYARETERLEHENLQVVSEVLDELHAAGLLDRDDPAAREVRQLAAMEFSVFFEEQVANQHAEQYLAQYDHALEFARAPG